MLAVAPIEAKKSLTGIGIWWILSNKVTKVPTSPITYTANPDFGKLVYVNGARHCGLVRLPDVPAQKRIQLMEIVITRYSSQLETGQIVTVRGDKIRVSKPIH